MLLLSSARWIPGTGLPFFNNTVILHHQPPSMRQAASRLSHGVSRGSCPGLEATINAEAGRLVRRRQQQRRCYASAPLPSPLRHPSSSSTASSSSSTFIPSSNSNVTGYGQPLPSTHPHLLQHGELTEGIPSIEYAFRRKKLMDSLPEKSVVVLAGGRLQYSSGSIFYKFRQASDFYYLTGWLEQDAAVILEKTSSSKGYNMTFFCRSRDTEQEIWEGPRNGPNGAVDIFGADNAMDIAHFTSHLKTLLTSTNTDGPIYVDIPDSSPALNTRGPRGAKTAKSIINFLTGGSASGARRTSLDSSLSSSMKKSEHETVMSLLNGSGGRTVRSLKSETEKFRIIKSENEIKVTRRAADISANGHARVMKMMAGGRTSAQRSNGDDRWAQKAMTEHDLVTEFEYHSGQNSMYLHYTSNSAVIQKDDLILFDAGCEFGGYASDITRTFPSSGKFSEPQKDLYTVVLRTLKECAKLCSQRRNVNLYDLHEKSRTVLMEELRQIGVDCRKDETLFGRIYPHFVSHPLGIDLHDCPTFQRHTRLEEGNVVTVEPGVFMPDHPSIPEAFRGIAIRLEEEVLVGKEDPIILSVDAPIEIVDVEACCQRLLESGTP